MGRHQGREQEIGLGATQAGDQVETRPGAMKGGRPRGDVIEVGAWQLVEVRLGVGERALAGQRQALVGDRDQTGPRGAPTLVPPTWAQPTPPTESNTETPVLGLASKATSGVARAVVLMPLAASAAV